MMEYGSYSLEMIRLFSKFQRKDKNKRHKNHLSNSPEKSSSRVLFRRSDIAFRLPSRIFWRSDLICSSGTSEGGSTKWNHVSTSETRMQYAHQKHNPPLLLPSLARLKHPLLKTQSSSATRQDMPGENRYCILWLASLRLIIIIMSD
jgi:hypothetical protein